jgi:Uma2 family endonuclease
MGSMATQPILRLTEEQYMEIERTADCRSEFFDGAMFAMSGGTSAHSWIKMNLAAGLHTRLRETACSAFDSDLKVKVAATGLITYPDFSIACGSDARPGRELILKNPVVLIEVLSPTTEAYDRGGKFHHYQQIPSLQEYILVSQSKPLVERYVRQSDGTWSLHNYVGLEGALVIGAAGIEIPLREIYDRVMFEESAIS